MVKSLITDLNTESKIKVQLESPFLLFLGISLLLISVLTGESIVVYGV